MKKLFIGLAFLGILTFAFPSKVNAVQDPCGTVRIYCPNGQGYMAIICSAADAKFFYDYYCGGCTQ